MFQDDDGSSESVERFGLRLCPHCDHEIRDPAAPACIYCGLPLTDPNEYTVLLELPRGLLSVLASQAIDTGRSGWHLVGELRRICLEQSTDELARWAAWLTLATLLSEICFDWSQPETFVRQIASGSVDFDQLRDGSRHAFSVRRFYADGAPHQVQINPGRLERLPESLRDEVEAILGRYRNIEPERMQELREKLASSMMSHRRRYWGSWQRWAIAVRWLWWLVIIILLLLLLVWGYVF